jgi:hypothetical protein
VRRTDPVWRRRLWQIVTQRLVKLLNDHLASAGVADRIHVLGGGNDQSLILLTAEQCTAIRSGAFSDARMP